MSEDKKEKIWRVIRIVCILVAFAFVLGVWLQVGFYPVKNFTAEGAGLFGDSFGFVNSLLSGLALVGAIVAILLQSHELSLQRKEMDESQEIAKKQVETMFLSTYLNGLIALKATPPAEDIYIVQERYVRILRSYIKILHPRAEEALGESVYWPKNSDLICERLSYLAEWLKKEWANQVEGQTGYQLEANAKEIFKSLETWFWIVRPLLEVDSKQVAAIHREIQTLARTREFDFSSKGQEYSNRVSRLAENLADLSLLVAEKCKDD